MTVRDRKQQDPAMLSQLPVRKKVARSVADILAPAPTVAGLLLVVTWHNTPTTAEALLWTGVTIVLGSLLPLLYILLQVRRGRLTDRHVRLREQRLRPLLVGTMSLLALLAVLVIGGAPRELVALVSALVLGLVIGTLVTLFWKISGHVGVVAGAVVVLALDVGPALLGLAPVVLLVGWARVEVGDHTPAQALGGAGLGAVVAGVMFTLLR